ncbi:polysaccharide biosynthesis/export family protein [Polaribacter sp. Z014]|uniref:polysaccharide biosynthesis/export family protein n=1 Tax=Polaribacter sp. Z014 TaxID=2927126 RepID=UPI0020228903|nr:polysaccharide biosynthesis/export family protein [Polaribacter sp. Z014]MCL7764544.1 polysaccharide biosynthesis/export family protein [Polaribacter sp. Z014]
MKYTNIIIVLFLVLASSCVSKQKMVYFGDKEGFIMKKTLREYESTIQKDDLLNINVSATNGEAVMPFNIYETPILGTGMGTVKPLPYLVNAEGEINFPVLGKLKVTGITTDALSVLLVQKLSEYITKPIVNITTTNFKITVLGEVNRPGTYSIVNKRITMLEALGLAGDLTINGNRVNITLIREKDGRRVFIPIDITNKELFNSRFYYLAQNDVIYVEPNKSKINSSAVGPNTSIIFTSIATLISIIAILR